MPSQTCGLIFNLILSRKCIKKLKFRPEVLIYALKIKGTKYETTSSTLERRPYPDRLAYVSFIQLSN